MTRKKCLHKLLMHPQLLYHALLILALLGSATSAENNTNINASLPNDNTDNLIVTSTTTISTPALIVSSTPVIETTTALETSTKPITTTSTTTTTTTTTTSTTTTTTTTDTTTTTTSTISTTPEVLRLHLSEFVLYNVSYQLDIINLDYSIKADFSSSGSQPESLIVNIEINCRNRDYDQAWSRPVEISLERTNPTKGHVQMLPLSQNAAPGSIIDCTAYVITNSALVFVDNLNSSVVQLVIDPPPITDLTVYDLNETSLQLAWKNPIIGTGVFSSLEVNCALNDTFTKESTVVNMSIQNKSTESYIVTKLIPGAMYSCQVATVRSLGSQEITKRTKSPTITKMTKLSSPVLDNGVKLEGYNTLQFSLSRPSGYYDYFQVQLNVPQSTPRESRTLRQVAAQNFNFSAQQTSLDISFSDIQPGETYELWSETFRSIPSGGVVKTESKLSKLLDALVLVNPIQVTDLVAYILSETDISVTWTKPTTGVYDDFRVYLYKANEPGVPVLNPIQTSNTKVTLSELAKDSVYIISVVTCSTLATHCDKMSEPVNTVFSYGAQPIQSVDIRSSSAGNGEQPISLVKNSSSLMIELTVNASTVNLCDMSRLYLEYLDLNKSINQGCYSEMLALPSNCNRQPIQKPVLNQCKITNMLCISTDIGMKCSMTLNKLALNTVYSIRAAVVSMNGNYKWPATQSSKTVQTDISLPSDFDQLEISYNMDLQDSLQSGYVLNIVPPQVNDKNGAISESYLFLVNIGASRSQFDFNKTFRLDTTDQSYLANLIADGNCSNKSSILNRPCLIKGYTGASEHRMVFIGNLALEDFGGLNLSTIAYENISSELIMPFHVYQFFYVFKIGDSSTTRLLFATNPSGPIRTISANDSASSILRSSLDTWMIILISVVSIVLLVTAIVCLIVMVILRYKPSKFHKAAVSQPRAQQNMSKMHSMEKINEYGMSIGACGVFYDFIEPSEFSREDMTNIWLVKHANGDLIFDEEYRNLPDFRSLKTTYASQSLHNEAKNRFLDIKAYDDSRVVLLSNTPSMALGNSNHYSTMTNKKLDTNSQFSVDKSIISSMSTSTSSNNSSELAIGSHHMNQHHIQDQGDYINANFVQGYSHDKKFIATQGPKRETIVDFWRMVSQYRVTAIVMLTKLVEKGVERCTQYWPEKLNVSEQYGDFEVTMKEDQKCGDYIKRVFELLYTGRDSQYTTRLVLTPATPGTIRHNSKLPLTVTQYYYPEWPDKDTPSTDPMSILHLIRDVNANHLQYQYPIVVHCSAGVGRTGTYITLDAMLEKINTEQRINIFGFISKIRERRQYLVQTSKQYVFIHEALYEYCMYGFTDVDAASLESHYKWLKEPSNLNAYGIPYPNNAHRGKNTRMQVEFDKLNNAFAPNSQAREAFNYENKQRNRFLDNICYDENRVRLSGLNGSSFINATKLKSYETLPNELIVTQDPMQNTVFEFWKMITEYDANIIVSLNKDFEEEVESCYWPTESEMVREFECEDLKFTVKLMASTRNDAVEQYVTIREFEVTEKKYDGSRKVNVTQFSYNDPWAENRAPRNRGSFISLVNQVQRLAYQQPHSRIAIHGHGGGSNCSVFCALSILIDNLKNDQRIDVARTVKKLKTQRPHMLESFEQYDFLYQCLIDYLKEVINQSVSGHTNQAHNDSVYFKTHGDLNDIDLQLGSNS